MVFAKNLDHSLHSLAFLKRARRAAGTLEAGGSASKRLTPSSMPVLEMDTRTACVYSARTFSEYDAPSPHTQHWASTREKE